MTVKEFTRYGKNENGWFAVSLWAENLDEANRKFRAIFGDQHYQTSAPWSWAEPDS